MGRCFSAVIFTEPEFTREFGPAIVNYMPSLETMKTEMSVDAPSAPGDR